MMVTKLQPASTGESFFKGVITVPSTLDQIARESHSREGWAARHGQGPELQPDQARPWMA